MSKKHTFKEYYDNNPEFKQRHKENMNEVIICECGCETTKGNKHSHQKSKIHCAKVELIRKDEELKKAKREIRKLKKMLKDIEK